MHNKTTLMLLSACLALSTLAIAETPARPVPESVARYGAGIQQTLVAKSRQSIEPVFSLGKEASKSLMGTVSLDSGNSVNPLESFDAKTFDSVIQKMKGFLVNREESVFVEPDIDFWVTMADSKGQKVDQDFFHLLKQTYPESVWPIYIRQQTDYSGCTDFGTKTLTQAYSGWTSFRKKFPSSYSSAVKHEIERVSRELNSTCVCHDKLSVIAEMEFFLSNNPTGETSSSIKNRLISIKRDEAEMMYGRPIKMRFNCISG